MNEEEEIKQEIERIKNSIDFLVDRTEDLSYSVYELRETIKKMKTQTK